MNRIEGQISGIQVSGSLSLVSVDCKGILLKSIIIDTPDTSDYLATGTKVQLLFKETEIVIAKPGVREISLQNRILAVISAIKQGDLLCSVILESDLGTLEAIISTNAVADLSLQPGIEVLAMIKLNEIMLSPC
ncbi:TOBE domain-containing protein [Zeaxanthinibacter enoshimensis]|uniref:Molybdopterin-binding protein n=1 Tax=Zeaxanthinibacter enoshimensis TaxID=392009 RepID=A0A4V6PWB0_9FLAO|nr:TOBE domain-containing protein [Zeaxanthinibacter enoshimensis]TDQ30953.1 molybdopterin-binding protein [Zeaxanthinibacter enoshimensis]